ncbi:glycosyltransferase family 2 protein [Lentilactobacillus hilgardii]|uniref:glycosyltransferase family 2 protein n=1 Tax=Lentilactobacillus hilgardii TaxID=1588 RepID=UPI00390C4E2E
MKYLLDIIIPCYNSENTLNNTVKSIEVQNTNFEFEIIIVDDGSTDKTSEVIDHLKNRYLNIRSYYQQNLKQSMARNIGIRHSIAKYIMFVDSDDILEPDMLRTMIGEMNIKGRDLTVCGIKKRYFNHEIIENKSSLIGINDKNKLLISYLTQNKELDVGLWNKIYKLSIIKKNNLFFSNGNFFEDSLFNLKYICCCNISKIEFISTPFYILNKGNNNTTRNFKPEIDNLALNYVVKAFQVLDRKNIKVPYKYKIGFEKRILIYVVHHHIKYDKGWSCEKQKKYCKSLRVKFSDFIGGSVLPLKYTIAYILIKNVPKIYSIIYSRYNL